MTKKVPKTYVDGDEYYDPYYVQLPTVAPTQIVSPATAKNSRYLCYKKNYKRGFNLKFKIIRIAFSKRKHNKVLIAIMCVFVRQFSFYCREYKRICFLLGLIWPIFKFSKFGDSKYYESIKIPKLKINLFLNEFKVW